MSTESFEIPQFYFRKVLIFRNHTDIMQLESPERMNDMSDKVATFAQRLREGLSIRHMTQTELAKRSQISKSSISRYVNGDWEGKQGAVYQLAKALEVTEAWLMGYDVPMENDMSTIPAGFEPLPERKRVPRVGQIACGEPILAEENVEGYDEVPQIWNADFTLRCKGDSMEPKIKSGDIVAIHIQPQVENGEVAAVLINGEATLKRVFLFADHIELRAENPAFPSIIRMAEAMNDVRIEGLAVGLCRKL